VDDSKLSCESEPCLNNATCLELSDGYNCSCPLGYIGDRCENVSCDAVMCENGGNCSHDAVSWWCSCPPQFDGLSSILWLCFTGIDWELNVNSAAMDSVESCRVLSVISLMSVHVMKPKYHLRVVNSCPWRSDTTTYQRRWCQLQRPRKLLTSGMVDAKG